MRRPERVRWACDRIRSRTLRPLVEHPACPPYTAAHMAYDLRRVRRKQLVERAPKSHAYHLASTGRHLALFATELYQRPLPRSGPAKRDTDRSPYWPPHGDNWTDKWPTLSPTYTSPPDSGRARLIWSE